MNMTNVSQALDMMGQGMAGIFVVLGAIALLVLWRLPKGIHGTVRMIDVKCFKEEP